MGFLACVIFGFIGYFDFGSRSCRSEYWWWTLFATLVGGALLIIDTLIYGPTLSQSYSGGVPGIIFSVLTFIPSLAVGCRRLHDIDKSGWWQLILLLPVLGWVILLIWFARAGDAHTNEYGDDPFRETGAFA